MWTQSSTALWSSFYYGWKIIRFKLKLLLSQWSRNFPDSSINTEKNYVFSPVTTFWNAVGNKVLFPFVWNVPNALKSLGRSHGEYDKWKGERDEVKVVGNSVLSRYCDVSDSHLTSKTIFMPITSGVMSGRHEEYYCRGNCDIRTLSMSLPVSCIHLISWLANILEKNKRK